MSNSPSPGLRVDALVAQVAEEIGDEIGCDKVRIDLIEPTIRDLDAERRFDTLQWPWPPWPKNKDEKRFARSLGQALAKLERRFADIDKNYKGPDGTQRSEAERENKEALRKKAERELALIERATYSGQAEFYEWKAQLSHWRECFEIFAGQAKADPSSLFPEAPTNWPLGQPRPSAPKFKQAAVEAAAAILDAHDIELTVTRKTATTRKASLFVQVATILAGINASNQCRLFLEKRKAGNRVSK